MGDSSEIYEEAGSLKLGLPDIYLIRAVSQRLGMSTAVRNRVKTGMKKRLRENFC